MSHDRRTDPVLFGRASELDALRAALGDALSGKGSLWLLAGEAGIGKTRLAAELAAEARQSGATVLWGVCWDGDGAPAFWPWIQALRAYVDTCAASGVSPGVNHVVSALLAGGAGTTASASPEELHEPYSRFELFEGIAAHWRAAAERAPLVLLFDDLHWADEPSVRLLEYVARATRDQRVLIVGTFRDVELVRDAPLTRTLDGLAREGQRISLRGLVEQDVGRLIERIVGAPPTAQLVTAVHRLSEGNPFFAGEIMRLLVAQGRLDQPDPVLGIPPGVRETLQRRLARLSSDCRALLAAASVIGREFAHRLLEAVSTTTDHAALSSLLDEAMAHQIIVARGEIPGTYAFSHALVRETLYQSLGTSRATLHRRVGEAIEALDASVREARWAELAHHFLQAAATGTLDRAIDYATRAAAAAARVLAYEDAARHYRAALQAIELTDQGLGGPPLAQTERQRAALLIDLAGVLKRSGDTAAAHDTAFAAAAVARAAGDGDLLARAALAVPWQLMPATVRRDVVALLEEALDRLTPGESTLRAGLLARLGAELYFDPEPQRRLALSQQAVTMARRLADPTALALSLNSRHWALWGPDGVEERLAVADEIVRLAEQAGDRERGFIGRTWRIADLLELGDVDAVDREIESCRTIAEALRQPQLRYFVTLLHAMRALLAGRFDDGERLAGEALRLGTGSNTSAVLLYATQLSAVRRAQGRLAEIEALVQAAPPQTLDLPAARCALAFLAAALGRAAEAREKLDRLAARDFLDIPRDGNWLNAMEQLVQVCVTLQDDRHAARLYQLLLPYAAHTLVIGAASMCYGSIAHYLGLLAALMRQWDAATAHFEDALRANLLLGARPALAHTQLGYANMLLARARAEDRPRAIALLTATCAVFEQLGMPPYLTQAQALLAQAQPAAAPEAPAALAAAPASGDAATNVFRRQGEYWDIHYAGSAIRMRESRGLFFLNQLLRHPGREFHVADLTMIATPPAPPTGSSYRTASAARLAEDRLAIARGTEPPDLPDPRAKAAYRTRLEGLRRELDEAERFNDGERAGRLRDELDFLAAELARRYQLAGHASQTLPIERMRKAVGNRIRATLSKLQREHPALSRHLNASLKLGTFCSYQPDPGAPGWSCD